MSAEERPATAVAVAVAVAGGETALIARHFAALGSVRDDVQLGIGDDAALLRAAAGCDLVMTTDALVEGAHFLPGADPESLGHRAAAVNLSDLAAMGAQPCWALLSLTLPRADDAWLQAFSRGCGAQLRAHRVALVGGNLARGPLNISLTLTGQVPTGKALRRDGARAGDLLCVSGTVGDAAAGLDLLRQRQLSRDFTVVEKSLIDRFEFPSARVALGELLRGVATACIDISDGLGRDLRRLAVASGCGALLVAEQLPLSSALRHCATAQGLHYALNGGEDYELLFTVPAGRGGGLQELAAAARVPVTVIGSLTAAGGVQLQCAGRLQPLDEAGFDHFC